MASFSFACESDCVFLEPSFPTCSHNAMRVTSALYQVAVDCSALTPLFAEVPVGEPLLEATPLMTAYVGHTNASTRFPV